MKVVVFPDVSARSLPELWSLAGRGAVVTGAARGIGMATATRLAEAGAAVLAVDRETDSLDRVTASLAARGLDVRPAAADVTDTAAVAGVVRRALDELPGLDVWVNSAVRYDFVRLLEVSDEDWDDHLDVNLRAVFVCCREAGKAMADDDGGVIVNVTSTEAHRAIPRTSPYITAKHGLVGLTRSLAVELGRFGVRALTVAPTLIETEGMAETIEAMGDEGRARWSARLPSDRLGVPDDVARVIVFAASDMAAMMTGSVLMVDGGEMAGVNRLSQL